MNVLILEDRGSVSHFLIEALEARKYQVFPASSVHDANSILEGEDQIDAIILDLNMSPDGLTEEEIKQTDFGLFTGWIWLNNYAWRMYPYLGNRTLIFSAYIDDLKRKYKLGNANSFSLIPKNNFSGSFAPVEEVISRLEKIRKKVEAKDE